MLLKQLASIFFSLVFAFYKLFPLRKDKVCFIMTHDINFNGNIKYIYEGLISRESHYKVYSISRADYSGNSKLKIFINSFRLFFIKTYHLATSSVVIMNNIFITGAYIKFKKGTRVIQVWHAVGSFKKFGEDYRPTSLLDKLQKKANRHYTDVIVNSNKDIEVYSRAFGVDKEIVSALGCASCDLFFNNVKMQRIRYSIFQRFPIINNKKVILYAPTFREDFSDNFQIKELLYKLGNYLDEQYVIIVKLHPQLSNKLKIDLTDRENILNLSYWQDINELMLVSDMLITDYSSLIFEYVLTGNPILFFAYDLDKYSIKRGFYHDYKSFVPGSIFYETSDLISAIKNNRYINNSQDFKSKWHDYFDGKSSERFIDKYFSSNIMEDS